MARMFAPSLSYVRCAVSMRKAALVEALEALELMDLPDDDPGVVVMRTRVDTCVWVLGLIDGKVER